MPTTEKAILTEDEKAAKKVRKAAKKAKAEAEGKIPESSKEKRKRDSSSTKSDALDFFAAPAAASSADAPKPKKLKKSKSSVEEVKDEGSSGGADKPLTADEFRALHSITVQGLTGPPPDPVLTWDDSPFPKSMIAPLSSAEGFRNPSPIQAMCWPVLVKEGRDCIGVAKTGSGKTLGFLLPAFLHLSQVRPAQQRGDKPRVLVLAPTRELAVQIHDEGAKFSSKHRFVVCFGGAPKSQQIRQLQTGCDVVVATPGRLNDLLEMRRCDLSEATFLVFDEADRMLDMGFEPQIRQVLQHCPDKSQRSTLFFTATWPKQVQALAATFLNDPVQINIGDQNSLSASKSITQTMKVLHSGHEKWPALEALLKELKVRESDKSVPFKAKTLVFSSTKVGCNSVADELWNKGESVDCLHGDKMQWERTAVLDKFRSGALNVVVCTDVAARGLDIDGVTHVVNYDFPAGHGAVEDYVHRIGRTGRGGKTGEAVTFFTPQDAKHANELVGIMEKAAQVVPEELRAMCWKRSGFGGGGGRGGGKGKGKGGGKGKGKGGGKGGYGGGFSKRW